jgi:hypothetical protein
VVMTKANSKMKKVMYRIAVAAYEYFSSKGRSASHGWPIVFDS